MLCKICNSEFIRPTGEINRALKKGVNLYCSKECAGKARRTNISIEEKKRLKSEYDKKYREINLDKKKKWAKDYFQRTYDPIKASIERKKNMHKHVEYCRNPEYKAKKKIYDKEYRYTLNYGEFAECAKILLQIESEIDRLEANIENQTFNKSQKRKRLWTKNNSVLII